MFAVLLLLAGAVAGAHRYWPDVWKSTSTISGPRKGNPPDAAANRPPINRADASDLPTGSLFPRRLLVISINSYLYANPIGHGSSDHNVHSLTSRIARVLHVQPSQIVELNDTSPPSKEVIEKTVSAFLETCRAQDRILVLFVGHVVAIGAEAYLVPLEGEPGVKETLIPLGWLFEQLTRCRARQKVVVLDTCRFDPSRGLERSGSGPMTEVLDGLLQKPPASVQLWSASVAGQYSYESDGRGIFLDKLYQALTPSLFKSIQEPQDPLPIETLAQVVNGTTAPEVASRFSSLEGQKAVQTPRLTGLMSEQGVPYDKDEPLPRALAVPDATPLPGGNAQRDQIRSILQEIALPPIRLAHAQSLPLEIETLLPFSANVIERYRPDYRFQSEIEHDSEKYPLRVQVIETVKLLRSTFDPQGPQGSLREFFQGGSNEQIKAAIFQEQMKVARVLSDLTERLEEMHKAGNQRDKEPSPRWQAHYDYILAQLLARTAYVSEYDLMLGKIRKDELPEQKPGLSTGWRLASREKMQSSRDLKDMAAESMKLFAKLIKEHAGTPWEVLAKRERLTALGLEWQAGN